MTSNVVDLLLPIIRRRRMNAAAKHRGGGESGWLGLEALESRMMLSAPTAVIHTTDVTSGGATSYVFTVDYTDPGGQGVKVSTLDNNDISVTEPNTSVINATFVGASPTTDGTPVTATYMFTPPGGKFDSTDNGTYMFALVANQVSDINGVFNATATPLGNATVNINDTIAPTAAVANTPDVTAAGAHTYSFTITYTDDQAVDVSTLDNSDIAVSSPTNNFSQNAVFISSTPTTNGSPITATYSITAPGNTTFTSADNGTYTIAVAASQVDDTNGNPVVAGNLGTFAVNINDTTAPTASLTNAPDLTTAGHATYDFTVTYTDDQAIDFSTLDNNDIDVTSPTNNFNENATFISAAPSNNGTPIVATYEITGPGNGNFVPVDNGTYTVTLASNQVKDTNGNPVVGAALHTFNVNIPADNVAPIGVANAAAVTTTAPGLYQFTVAFTGDNPIDVSTLGSGNITVTSPTNNFSENATFVSSLPSTNGSPITATYTIPVPGNGFVNANNGVYTINENASQVKDTNSNFVAAGSLGTFNVNVPADNVAPIGVATAPAVTTTAPGLYQFTVLFTGDNPIDVSTLGSGNITVTSPTNNFSENATFVSSIPSTNGSPITATYTIPVPGNGFVNANNGVYTINENASQVEDTNSNFVAAGSLGTFNVNVPVPDTTPPTAVAAAVDITAATSAAYTFSITYTDDTAIKASTLAGSTPLVTGPNNFSENATFLSVDTNSDGTPRTVIYSLTAPVGGFVSADNGAYVINELANQVTDTSGNPVAAGQVGTFNVTIAAADTTPPTAALTTALDETTAGATTYQFTVTYTDDTAVMFSTLDGSDVTVNGPAGSGFTQAATFMGALPSTDGTPIAATYQITAPGGTFDSSDNGAYTVAINTGQVTDTSGNPVAANATLGTFNVNVAASVNAPVGVANAPDITTTVPNSNPQFMVTFTGTNPIDVSTLNNAQITVVGPAGSSFTAPATLVNVNNPTNGSPRTATFSFAAPAGGFTNANNGVFTIITGPNGVKDTSGNAIAAGPLGTFHVAVPGLDTTAPTATATIANVTTPSVTPITFTVTYADNTAVNAASLGNNNLVVNGPNGFTEPATFVSVTPTTNGTPLTATYTIAPPAGGFTSLANGTFTVNEGTSPVTDTSGNAVAAGQLTTFQVTIAAGSAFGTIAGHNTTTTIADRDGTLVTFALKGPGTGTVSFDGVGFILDFTDTTIASSVTVTTKKSKTIGDDSRTIIDAVNVGGAGVAGNGDSLNTFTAKTADLKGALVVNGTLLNLSLGNVYDNGSVAILDQANMHGVTNAITLGVVTDGSLTSNDAIKTLTVAAWNDRTAPRDVIMAPSIQTITSKGDFNADLTLTAAGVLDLSKLTVSGLLDDAVIRSAASVGTISVGAMRDSSFYVGLGNDVTGLPGVIPAGGTITSFTVKGLSTEAHSFVNSFIAADTIKTIKLTTVDVDNNGVEFGIEANHVTAYSRTGRTLKNLLVGTDDDLGDYVVRVL